MKPSEKTTKKTILVFCDYFIPGYRSGGPQKSIVNLLCALAREFRFIVFTRNHDLNVRQPYSDNQTAVDIRRMPFEIKYSSGSIFNLSFLKCLRRSRYDAVYLNSFFSPWQTIRYLVFRKIGIVPVVPVLLAPRGEFSEGALQIKWLKKKVYLALARRLLFSQKLEITWHASTPYEADDIRRIGIFGRRVISAGNCTCVAADIASFGDHNGFLPLLPCQLVHGRTKQTGSLRIVFLSRVSVKKNLLFAIRLVKTLNCKVQFDIYGPIEDHGYWDACQIEMRGASSGAQIVYRGGVHPAQVTDTFRQYHVMLLPTEGENYGHVIVEALLAGCPVIISRTTPWRDLRENNAGEDCPPGDGSAFTAALMRYCQMNDDEWRASSFAAVRYAKDRCRIDEVVEANRVMLNGLLSNVRS